MRSAVDGCSGAYHDGTKPCFSCRWVHTKAINFDDWVEHNTEAYVARAVTLAIQKEELRKDRVNVRQNFLNSVLCQGKAHAKAFFDAVLNL